MRKVTEGDKTNKMTTEEVTQKDLYIPKNSVQLSSSPTRPQIRLGVQGPPKTGKSHAGLTFPNPVALSFDRGFGAHTHRTDVYEVPIYDPKFVESLVPRGGVNAPPNRKDATTKWLCTEGAKLTKNQTLMVDGLTGLQNAYTSWYTQNPILSRQGKIDDYAEWRIKVEWFGELCEILKSLRCDVVFVGHETPDRNKEGELNGMVRPLITGQFGDQLASHFTSWFRALVVAKPVENKEVFMKKYLCDEATLKEWIASNDTPSIFLWQTISDSVVSCGTSDLVKAPKYVLQDYKTFEKYRRK